MPHAVFLPPVTPLYAAPREGTLVDEALSGEECEFWGEDAFVRVVTAGGYAGFVRREALRAVSAFEATLTVRSAWCDVLDRPQVQGIRLATLPRGALLTGRGIVSDGWKAVRLADGREGFVRARLVDPRLTAPPAEGEALRRLLAEAALSYLGAPYRWGGKTPAGIDCSGLCCMAYRLCGIRIWRDAALVDGYPVRPIPRERMARGDLLYFPGHMALYLGGGRYVHATAHPGGDGVVISSLLPAAPDHRPDLARSLLAVGSVF